MNDAYLRPPPTADHRSAEVASDVVNEAYIEALSLRLWKEARMDLSVKEFLYALVRLGGHLGRKGDRPGARVAAAVWSSTKTEKWLPGAGSTMPSKSSVQRLVWGSKLTRGAA